jgi:hypothetical protein
LSWPDKPATNVGSANGLKWKSEAIRNFPVGLREKDCTLLARSTKTTKQAVKEDARLMPGAERRLRNMDFLSPPVYSGAFLPRLVQINFSERSI